LSGATALDGGDSVLSAAGSSRDDTLSPPAQFLGSGLPTTSRPLQALRAPRPPLFGQNTVSQAAAALRGAEASHLGQCRGVGLHQRAAGRAAAAVAAQRQRIADQARRDAALLEQGGGERTARARRNQAALREELSAARARQRDVVAGAREAQATLAAAAVARAAAAAGLSSALRRCEQQQQQQQQQQSLYGFGADVAERPDTAPGRPQRSMGLHYAPLANTTHWGAGASRNGSFSGGRPGGGGGGGGGSAFDSGDDADYRSRGGAALGAGPLDSSAHAVVGSGSNSGINSSSSSSSSSSTPGEFRPLSSAMFVSQRQPPATSAELAMAAASQQPPHSIGFDARYHDARAVRRRRAAARQGHAPLVQLRASAAQSRQRCHGPSASVASVAPRSRYLGSIHGASSAKNNDDGPLVPAGAGWPPTRQTRAGGDPNHYAVSRRLLTRRRQHLQRPATSGAGGSWRGSASANDSHARAGIGVLGANGRPTTAELGGGAGGSRTRWTGGSISRPRALQGFGTGAVKRGGTPWRPPLVVVAPGSASAGPVADDWAAAYADCAAVAAAAGEGGRARDGAEGSDAAAGEGGQYVHTLADRTVRAAAQALDVAMFAGDVRLAKKLASVFGVKDFGTSEMKAER
jgi:hypothetical protein